VGESYRLFLARGNRSETSSKEGEGEKGTAGRKKIRVDTGKSRKEKPLRVRDEGNLREDVLYWERKTSRTSRLKNRKSSKEGTDGREESLERQVFKQTETGSMPRKPVMNIVRKD